MYTSSVVNWLRFINFTPYEGKPGFWAYIIVPLLMYIYKAICTKSWIFLDFVDVILSHVIYSKLK